MPKPLKLTENQKIRIRSDYIDLQNYAKVAKLHGVSDVTVRNIVKEDPETLETLSLKKGEAIESVLEKMEQQHDNVYKLYQQGLKRIFDVIPKTSNPQQIATAIGIMIDKQTKLMDYRLKEREIEVKQREVALREKQAESAETVGDAVLQKIKEVAEYYSKATDK